jgi:hypothetical protein
MRNVNDKNLIVFEELQKAQNPDLDYETVFSKYTKIRLNFHESALNYIP